MSKMKKSINEPGKLQYLPAETTKNLLSEYFSIKIDSRGFQGN